MKRRLFPLPAALMLCNCATYVDSVKDDGTGEGLRYSLPVPFLMVTPKPDGTLEPTFVYLPDPEATYTLKTRSVVSSYTLDVQLENQMLKSVSLSSKSDAVAAALAESAGNFAKARLDADRKAEEDAEKADADAAKALAEASLAVETADAKVTVLENGSADKKDILAARVELEQAKLKFAALKRAKQGAGAALASGNAPQPSRATPDATAAGPMLFRIVPTDKGGKKGVKLVAVKGPTVFATSVVARNAATPGFQPAGTHTVRANAAGDLKLELAYNRTVTQVKVIRLSKQQDPATELVDRRPTIATTADPAGTKFNITFKPATEAGEYTLYLEFEVTGGRMQTAQIYFTIVR